MSWFTEFGPPSIIKPSRKLTPKARLKSNIEKQRNLLAGRSVLGAKGKPIRSWFRAGRFSPQLGIHGVFGQEKGYAYREGQELEILQKFESALNAGEFDSLLDDLAKKFPRK